MADIPVTFSTNAGQVSAQIDKAAASTAKAGQSARTFASGVDQETASLRKATHAAREHNSAVGRVTGGLLKSAAQRSGMGQQFEGAGKILGGAGGAIGLVGATLAMTGVGFAIGALTGVVEAWLNQAKESAAHLAGLNKNLSDAKDKNASLGLDAASKFGPNLTALNSMGGGARDIADKFSEKFGFADASKATLEALKMFPDRAEQALKEANDASRITGQPLAESMSAMKGMPNSTIGGGRAAAGVVGQFFGHAIPFDQIQAMRDRSDSDPENQDLRKLSRVGGRMDAFGIDNIGAAVGKASDDATKTIEALTEATIELLAEQRKQTKLMEQEAERARMSRKFMELSGGGGY